MADNPWEKLERDIEYAIWRAPVRAAKRELSASDRANLAGAIAQHLKRCNWTIQSGQAPPLHPETRYRAP